MLSTFASPPLFSPALVQFVGGSEKRLQRSLEVVENYMNDAIDARKEMLSDDLLSRFLKKRDMDGNLFPISVLHHIALNFVLAERDTSSVALSWFFWLVMNNSNAKEKIIREITTVLRPGDRRFIYMKTALAETLRLYLSVPGDFKYVFADDVLPNGKFVPARSTATYIRRMKTIWGKDCLEFKSESRWHQRCSSATCCRRSPATGVEQKMSLTMFMENGLRDYLSPQAPIGPAQKLAASA
ncbi:hypothetical protein NL676_005876 [Syzygium grande]|nr:hypothetical protein NL676_005876 [Syzygium grande]